jgi:hypothetical protein
MTHSLLYGINLLFLIIKLANKRQQIIERKRGSRCEIGDQFLSKVSFLHQFYGQAMIAEETDGS